MQREPYRLPPKLPAHAMKTYAILAPLSTHWREVGCEQADCEAHRLGWQTHVDESSELGLRQGHYIRKESGRTWRVGRLPNGVTVFEFPPGQQCFRSPHRIRIDRPELFVVREGDWRGNPRGGETIVHDTPENWVDDFANHQIGLADRLEKG